MNTLRARIDELRALVDEVAPPGWTASPVWWALVGGVALAEPHGRPGDYLISDAEPRADTYMGVPGPAPDDAAGRIGWAIASAHAAVRAVLARDGSLPSQPLTVAVALHRGAARVVPIASPWRVAFALADRVVTALLDPRGPAHEAALARTLAGALRGERAETATGLDRAGHEPTPMMVVTIGDDAPARAHHGHRRGWHRRGGPWLGVSRAGGQTVVSTCHMVVDGWGHALLTTDVVRGLDRAAARALSAVAAAAVAGAATLPPPPPPATTGESLGVAWRRVPGPMPPFMRQAYALGRLLHRDRHQPGAPRSPTFQVPTAPGAADDPTRFARRVRPAILNVRFPDGVAEPEATFAARARAAIAREAQGQGLISRLLTALTAVPAPLGWKRGVVAARTGWVADAVDVLAGTGCLSSLRQPGAPPLVAVSSPAQLLPPDDRRATSVLTVIGDGDGATLTLAGSGRATAAGEAEALLEEWCAEVSASQLDDWRASR